MNEPSLAPGIVLACFAAGPMFVTSTALAMLYANLPKPILVSGSELFGFVGIFVPAIVVGLVLAAVPTIIGANVMRACAERYEAARAPILWTAAGALSGAALALAFGTFSEPSVAFGLIVTSAFCARICRFQLRWD